MACGRRIGRVHEIEQNHHREWYVDDAVLVNDEIRKFPELADREKASYELRKMCVDRIYHKFGAEMASAISGDDIRTLTYFYADTAHVEASKALTEGQCV